MSEPILALEALEPENRPYLTINGTAYQYRVPQQFGLAEIAKLAKLDGGWRKASLNLSKMSDAELAQVETLLADLIALILEAPPEVLAVLTTGQRIEVLHAYRDFQRPALPMRLRRKLTSGRSSRASSGSTAAPPATG